MKMLLIQLVLFLLALTASAQRSFIGYPTEGATLHLNKKFTLQLIRPNSIQGSREVGIAIGLLSCPVNSPNPCPPPSQQLGEILFTGQFNPQIHEQPGRPYQNFTLTVPDLDFLKGRDQLSVVRFHIIGAGPSPVLEFNNITVNVV